MSTADITDFIQALYIVDTVFGELAGGNLEGKCRWQWACATLFAILRQLERQGANFEIVLELLAMRQQEFAQWRSHKDATIDRLAIREVETMIR